MSLPFSLFGIHPREQEAPAWAKALCEGMGLVIEKQDTIMSQMEDALNDLSNLRSKLSHLKELVQARQSQETPEPDMSPVRTEVQEMSADADSMIEALTASSQATEQPADSSGSTIGTTTSPPGSQAGA